jgi:hypothetical protein
METISWWLAWFNSLYSSQKLSVAMVFRTNKSEWSRQYYHLSPSSSHACLDSHTLQKISSIVLMVIALCSSIQIYCWKYQNQQYTLIIYLMIISTRKIFDIPPVIIPQFSMKNVYMPKIHNFSTPLRKNRLRKLFIPSEIGFSNSKFYKINTLIHPQFSS